MKFKISKFKKVKSTNEEAIKLIKKNKIKPTIITAVEQTKGKGTMGKKWVSKKGNMFVSIFFQISSYKIKFREFSILNAQILRSVLNKYSKFEIKIKWPNDILIKKKKLSGILQEIITHKKKKYLIIGVGINTVSAPNSKKFKAISLASCSRRKVANQLILKDIKKSYESLLIDIRNDKFSLFKKNIYKG